MSTSIARSTVRLTLCMSCAPMPASMPPKTLHGEYCLRHMFAESSFLGICEIVCLCFDCPCFWQPALPNSTSTNTPHSHSHPYPSRGDLDLTHAINPSYDRLVMPIPHEGADDRLFLVECLPSLVSHGCCHLYDVVSPHKDDPLTCAEARIRGRNRSALFGVFSGGFRV